jgi:hypothetical protein
MSMNWRRNSWSASLASLRSNYIVISAASIALEREGPGLYILRKDFLTAMEASKRAKQEIGVVEAR